MSTTISVNNATLVAKMYDALGRGDVQYIIDNLTEDGEWNVMGKPLMPQAGSYIGKDTIQMFNKLNDILAISEFTVHSITEINDTDVVALGRYTLTGRATGKSASSNWAMHWKFENGKVKYFQDFYDSALMSTLLS
jgi:hypothetical protein